MERFSIEFLRAKCRTEGAAKVFFGGAKRVGDGGAGGAGGECEGSKGWGRRGPKGPSTGIE